MRIVLQFPLLTPDGAFTAFQKHSRPRRPFPLARVFS